MDDERLVFREYLTKLPRPALEKLCAFCGFTERETKLVVMHYCDKLSEDYIADSISVSRSTYHRMKMAMFEKIRSQLHLALYNPEETDFQKRIEIINTFLAG